ncbi:carbonyl reductase [NADPH] 1-like [Alosa sapidissima]|uniref:carbonyl reductase [NADPH] 1-like n=1 Tax=Alosa sapidissima TaxID=34773 RepID=UPI001C096779|nr:carbonyl reductase [NADPH] 1-like [Alosa sapidissima]
MCSVFLPIMKPGGRVVNVLSIMGKIALGRCSSVLQGRFRSDGITEDELVLMMEQFIKDAQKSIHLEEGWTDTAYGVSKIGLTILSRILARRLRQDRPQDNILLNSCCPGWVKTDMSGHNGPLTPDQGADTPVYLALLTPGADEPHGQ